MGKQDMGVGDRIWCLNAKILDTSPHGFEAQYIIYKQTNKGNNCQKTDEHESSEYQLI